MSDRFEAAFKFLCDNEYGKNYPHPILLQRFKEKVKESIYNLHVEDFNSQRLAVKYVDLCYWIGQQDACALLQNAINATIPYSVFPMLVDGIMGEVTVAMANDQDQEVLYNSLISFARTRLNDNARHHSSVYDYDSLKQRIERDPREDDHATN